MCWRFCLFLFFWFFFPNSLFEDAASKLNLQALLSFLTELGEASRQQLQSLQSHTDAGDPSDILPVVTQSSQHCPHLPTNALHLYRLQEVLLAVVHSPRPLLHLMQVWAAISPYLVEVIIFLLSFSGRLVFILVCTFLTVVCLLTERFWNHPLL